MKKNKKNSSILNKDGFPILGWLVNYSTERGFSMKRSDLKQHLDNVGIDSSLACSVIPKNAAIRAVREIAQSSKGKLHRKVVDESSTAAFVIANFDVDQQSFDTTFNTETKGILDKDSKQFKVTGTNKQQVEDKFKERLEVYASDQIRSIVLRYIKRECAGITYLETGNVYFVPVAKKDALDKLEKLFKDIGSSIKLIKKDEVDTSSVRSVMWEVTVGELKHNLKSLKDDFESIEDGLTNKSIDARLKKYDQLKTKVSMFEDVLQGTATDLKAELDTLTKMVKKKVLE